MHTEQDNCHLLGIASVEARARYLTDEVFRQQAETLAEQVRASHPAGKYTELGSQALKLGFYELAREAYRKSLEAGFAKALALNNLAYAYDVEQDYSMARRMYMLALEHQPAYPLATNNLSNLLVKMALTHTNEDSDASLARAEQLLYESLSLKPGNDWAMLNLGNLYRRRGQDDKAIKWFEWAFAENPQNHTAPNNLAYLLLEQEQLERGFQLYEHRFRSSGFPSAHAAFKGFTYWDGKQDLNGKTILLHWEQGFGDMIQFSRYCFLLRQQYPAARIILELHPELVDLFSQLADPQGFVGSVAPACAQAPVDRVIANSRTAKDLREVDLVFPLMSLARIYTRQVSEIPAWSAYLRAPAAGEEFRARLEKLKTAARKKHLVGLTWAGRASHGNDKHRSMHLRQLAAALSGPYFKDALFVSLQKDGGAEKQVQELGLAKRFHLAGSEIKTFGDTAAFMSCLDLFVSVDSANLHLAGALGLPAIGLIAKRSDWRWFRNYNTTAWYPNTYLVRQKEELNWDGLGHDLAEALEHLGLKK